MTSDEAANQFEQILKNWGFKTATLNESARAQSIEGKGESPTVLPDILTVDRKERGWCFEVKDEEWSKAAMRELQISKGYSGPVLFLKTEEAKSYLNYSLAFGVPCVIVVREGAHWKVGFLTRVKWTDGSIVYNRELIVPEWNDQEGVPIMPNALLTLERFLEELDGLRLDYWGD